MKLTVTYFGTVNKLQDRDDLSLVTDSQDVEGIKDLYGNDKELEEFDGFFVKVGEGEYTELYGFHGITPYLKKPVYKVTIE